MDTEARLSVNLVILCFVCVYLGLPFIGCYFAILVFQLYEEIIDEILIDIIFEGDIEDPDFSFSGVALQYRISTYNEFKYDTLLLYTHFLSDKKDNLSIKSLYFGDELIKAHMKFRKFHNFNKFFRK